MRRGHTVPQMKMKRGSNMMITTTPDVGCRHKSCGSELERRERAGAGLS